MGGALHDMAIDGEARLLQGGAGQVHVGEGHDRVLVAGATVYVLGGTGAISDAVAAGMIIAALAVLVRRYQRIDA